MQGNGILGTYESQRVLPKSRVVPYEYQHKARVTTSLGALIKAIQDVTQPYKETQVVQMTVQILLRHAHGVIIAHDANDDDVSIEN